MKKFYVTTPLYYVNDKPHIGHAYTTVAADVIARYQRLKGREVYFLTGTDEHGSKIERSAKKAGIEVGKFVEKIAKEFKSTWDLLDISYDDYIRTTESRHQKGVEAFFEKVKKDLYEDEYQGMYCEGCERFLVEKELENGLCPDHKKPPQKLCEKNYFFNLQKYLPRLKKLIESDEILVLPKQCKQEILGLFKQKLPDFSVSREKVKWGIKFPYAKNQVVYVWVEALQNYITAPGFGRDEKKFSSIWPADIHFMAKDILKFHAIFWPAMLLSANLHLPKTIFAHGFFTIDGQKMSKTLGNIIDPKELVEKYGVDATRYLLLSQFPFGQDGDIKKEGFVIRYNADLANELGNLVSRVVVMAKKFNISNIKAPSKNLNLIDKELGNFDIYGALRRVTSAVKKANKTVDTEKPWQLAKSDPRKLETVIKKLYRELYYIAYNLEPFMPSTAKKIQENLKSLDSKAIFPRITK